MTTKYLKAIFELKRIFQVLVKEKYIQLCLASHIGEINIMELHKCYKQYRAKTERRR
jgi:hypothetical protein